MTSKRSLVAHSPGDVALIRRRKRRLTWFDRQEDSVTRPNAPESRTFLDAFLDAFRKGL